MNDVLIRGLINLDVKMLQFNFTNGSEGHYCRCLAYFPGLLLINIVQYVTGNVKAAVECKSLRFVMNFICHQRPGEITNHSLLSARSLFGRGQGVQVKCIQDPSLGSSCSQSLVSSHLSM